MAWELFTAKNSADDGTTAPSTISDKDWRRLQSRAKAPKFGTKEHEDRARRGAAQYRNRKNN